MEPRQTKQAPNTRAFGNVFRMQINYIKLLLIGLAFFQYEISTGGLTKICVYESHKGVHSQTIESYAICPLTIEVE